MLVSSTEVFPQNLSLSRYTNVLVSSYGRQTAKGGGHSFWTRVVKPLKVAAFSHLVLKSNNFEKIKYAQKKEILRNVQYKKTLADPLHRFRNFEQ